MSSPTPPPPTVDEDPVSASSAAGVSDASFLRRALTVSVDFFHWLVASVPRAVADFKEHGLRLSYLLLPGVVLAAVVINLFLPHGWTAWPFVAAVMIFAYVHEAADRNGQGIPPGNVYLFFAGAVGAWIVFSAVLSLVNPLIVLGGVGFLVYYALRAYLRDRVVRRLHDQRRAEGRCVFCGEFADPAAGICLNCGNEPDPLAAQTGRVQAVVRNRGGAHRTRAALQQDTLASSARKKETRLLANSKYRSRRPR